MRGLVHRNVAILAIHLQFTRMQCVAKWNRLQGTVASIERFGARSTQKQHARVGSTRKYQKAEQCQELIRPPGE